MVLDLNEKVVCKVVRLWNKSITTDIQLAQENECRRRYNHEPVDAENCRNHKLAKCFVKIVLPEGAE